MSLFFRLIELFIYSLWLIIGFILWIPLLFRGIAIYSSSLTYSLVVDAPEEYMRRRHWELERVILFYASGFKKIMKLFNGMTSNSYSYAEKTKTNWLRFFLEILWTALFWFASYFFFLGDYPEIGHYFGS